MKLLASLILISLFLSQPSLASEREPILDQYAGLRFTLLNYGVIECDENGNGGMVGIYFGTSHEEFLKSLVLVAPTENKTWSDNYGPYETYKEYVLATRTLKAAFLSYLENSDFSILKTLPSGQLPSITQDLDDPWTVEFRNEYVNPLVHKFAKQMKWPVYTTIVYAGFEAGSDSCRNENGDFEARREIQEIGN